MELKVTMGKKGKLTVSEQVFGIDFNESLIHQVVTTYQANARSGNSAQKTRSEVRGGGAKPWKQKGTGRARAGTIRSPIWRGGGVTFAKKPRDYSMKLNKKMYGAAMRSILSELYRQERLLITDVFEATSNKTQEMRAKLKDLAMENVLIITDVVDENLYLSTRNIPNVAVCDHVAIDPVGLLSYKNILITSSAIKLIEERLK